MNDRLQADKENAAASRGATPGGGERADAMRVQMRALAGAGHEVQRSALEPGAASKGTAPTSPLQFAKKSGKERGSDIPSWAKGAELDPGETPEEGATSLCDQQYGAGKYPKGPGSEHNKIKKYFERTKDEK